MRKVLAGAVIVVVSLFMLSASNVLAQIDYCEGNFDYDKDVDGGDAALFKSDFGRSPFSNPCPPKGPAPVPRTGQAGCWDVGGNPNICAYSLGEEWVVVHGQDGAWQKGVEWPNPRFTDNNDGTITDNLTGLIWLKDANCFGQKTWGQAIDECDGLSAGYCGLTDGSQAGDWRLPNRFELESLLNLAYNHPPLSDTAGTGHWSNGDPFNNVQTSEYWSSTTFVWVPRYAYFVHMSNGSTPLEHYKTVPLYLWPVRGGQ